MNQSILIANDSYRVPWDHVANHPLQSWAWGEFKKKLGVDTVRLAVMDRNELINCWQLSYHALPFLPFTVGYFPKGPLPSESMIDVLTMIGKKKHAIFTQLEPNSLIDQSSIDPNPLGFLSQKTSRIYPSRHPLFTKYSFVLDLTKSETTLLSTFHHKTRYNIKVAQNHGIIVKENNSNEAFDLYLKLLKETTKRQRYFAHNQQYHRLMWQTLHPAGIARIWTASFQEKTLAAWIIFAWKETIYYPYGASSRDHKEVQAPTLLLWEIARWGKRKGYKKFDLWGALGPKPNNRDPWYGFHRFKEGFRPSLVESIGSYDLIHNLPLYKLYTTANTLRWTILKL